MCEWIDFSQWEQCRAMERPGYVFEVVNGEDQRLLTNCTVPLEMPFDWTSSPVKFRLVPEPPLRRSDPLPPPVGRD